MLYIAYLTIIYKGTKWGRKEFKLEKDSYVFDLKTGQRIYLDNFLKENEDYKDVIEKYIFSNLKNSNSNEYKNKINIEKDTNYYIYCLSKSKYEMLYIRKSAIYLMNRLLKWLIKP